MELKHWTIRKGSKCETPLGDALMVFRHRVTAGKVSRLDLLIEWAHVVVPCDKAYVRRRYAHRYQVPERGGSCWACKANRKLVLHHVIQVQHGGRNQVRNLVWICHRCHEVIHPWLKTQPVKVSSPTFDETPRLVRAAVTEEYIESRRTVRGGYTRAQLAEWGVSWPPPAGWKKALTSLQ